MKKQRQKFIIKRILRDILGFPGGASGKEPTSQYRRLIRHGFDPWVGKISWRKAWQPTPVFLHRELRGQRGLVGYSPWGPKESDVTEATYTDTLPRSIYIKILFLPSRNGGGVT